MNKEAINKSTLLLSTLLISALFLSMIHQFLIAILLAGIFSALAYPLYHRFVIRFKGKCSLASLTTLLLIIVVVLLPLSGLLGIVATQAIKVGETVRPWVAQQLSHPEGLSRALEALPFFDKIQPYQNLILTKAGELVEILSGFFIHQISAATMGTANFIVMLMVMLYTMFFFLIDGHKLINKMLYYLPLEDHDERLILEKFTSVTLATLKGTAVIGIIQGSAAGLAFVMVGIPSAVFWGAIMTVLSIIPGIGSALIWVPAAIILAASGSMVKGVGLAIFCGLVVGSLDNLLRPMLVGKDTQMHELMIFFGTLGGILFFGVLGFIIGPIVAALFVTIWEIYGAAFKDVLPPVEEYR